MIPQKRGANEAAERALGPGHCLRPFRSCELSRRGSSAWAAVGDQLNPLGLRGKERKGGWGRSYLQPPDKSCDLLSHEAGVVDSGGVVVSGQGDPVCQCHVHRLGQPRLQRGHHLPDPAFQQAVQLRVGTQGGQLHREGTEGASQSFPLFPYSPLFRFLQLLVNTGSFL